MDSNGLRFWMLAGKDDWTLPKELVYDGARRTLRLSDVDDGRVWPGTQGQADSILKKVPRTIDTFDRIAFAEVAAGGSKVKGMKVGGDTSKAKLIFDTPQEITDIAAGADATLYISTTTSVWLRDMHFDSLERWKPVELTAAGVKPFRIAADFDGGCWVLCQDGKLARVTGGPLTSLATERLGTELIRPVRENPNPPNLKLWFDQPVIGAGEKPAAVCYSAQFGLAVIASTNADAKVYLPLEGRSETLKGMRFPTSVRWLSENRIALLYPGATEAAIFEIGRGFLAELYPLNGPKQPLDEPFVQFIAGDPLYLRDGKPRRLDRVSLPSLAREGSGSGSHPLDSGNTDTIWHRLYMEASIPAHCAIEVRAGVSQSGDSMDVREWHSHFFGRAVPGKPTGVWMLEASEIPFHPGMLPCSRQMDRAGLFTVLLQRTGYRVSSLRGRFLHVEVRLNGSHQATPEIAALRAYASRFSYAENYLPELYRETEFGPDADVAADQTSAPDFLNRFLFLFESVLTPIEDRVASAHLLTRPDSTRDQDLDWLSQWLGLSFDPAFTADRKRDWIKAAPEMSKWRGTVRGLSLALEAATGGGVSSGEIVIVEHYRLRRVLATILGVDLTDYDDPLLPEADYGGNSIVGPTLVLGDEFQRQFLALFDASLKVTSAESKAIAGLFDDLAWRATVLVHQEVEPQDLGLIRRVAEREKPAHVQLTVVPAAFPFLAGIASLVGVDTYLANKPRPGSIRVGLSRIGVWDMVRQPGSLDPNFTG